MLPYVSEDICRASLWLSFVLYLLGRLLLMFIVRSMVLPLFLTVFAPIFTHRGGQKILYSIFQTHVTVKYIFIFSARLLLLGFSQSQMKDFFSCSKCVLPFSVESISIHGVLRLAFVIYAEFCIFCIINTGWCELGLCRI